MGSEAAREGCHTPSVLDMHVCMYVGTGKMRARRSLPSAGAGTNARASAHGRSSSIYPRLVVGCFRPRGLPCRVSRANGTPAIRSQLCVPMNECHECHSILPRAFPPSCLHLYLHPHPHLHPWPRALLAAIDLECRACLFRGQAFRGNSFPLPPGCLSTDATGEGQHHIISDGTGRHLTGASLSVCERKKKTFNSLLGLGCRACRASRPSPPRSWVLASGSFWCLDHR